MVPGVPGCTGPEGNNEVGVMGGGSVVRTDGRQKRSVYGSSQEETVVS